MASKEVTERLDVIIKLLAMNFMKDFEGTQKEQIIKLNKIGLQPKEIAYVMNKTSNYIRKTLSEAKKEGLL